MLDRKLETKMQLLMREETLRKCKDTEHKKALQELTTKKEHLSKRCSKLAHLDQGYQAQLRKQEQQYQKMQVAVRKFRQIVIPTISYNLCIDEWISQKQYQRLLKTDSKDRKQASMRVSSKLTSSSRTNAKASSNSAPRS